MIQPDTATPDVPTSGGATIERVLRPLARKAGGMTGADIREVVQNARRKARREKRAVTYDDIESLLAGSRPARSAQLRWRMAVHEAGHAVARLYFQLGPIIEITIDAPEGGYTLGSVGQDEHTEELFAAFLVAYLAGRAAEEEILGSATSNSGGSEQSDLALATDLALEMETVLGFSRKWPLLYRKPKDGATILATDLELAQRVHARLASAHKAARDIVRKQKTAVQFLANILLAEETLEGPELDAVLEQVRQKMVDLPVRG
ncbi:MAG: ATP-dependent Zn protease [Hyphomicrobiales bacterium]|nr:ATP-dependent Zn protease [Hyphomicrobiales bacterium]